MAEYIDRGELEKVLVNFYDRLAGHRPDFYAGISAALRVIEEETTNADVAPVRNGRWKNEGMGDFLCSLCSYIASAAILNNYCPNCGAKMDGE